VNGIIINTNTGLHKNGLLPGVQRVGAPIGDKYLVECTPLVTGMLNQHFLSGRLLVWWATSLLRFTRHNLLVLLLRHVHYVDPGKG
jgi:hypothetical protein